MLLHRESCLFGGIPIWRGLQRRDGLSSFHFSLSRAVSIAFSTFRLGMSPYTDSFSGLTQFRSTFRTNLFSSMRSMWPSQLHQRSLISSRILTDGVRASSAILRHMESTDGFSANTKCKTRQAGLRVFSYTTNDDITHICSVRKKPKTRPANNR